ncbi:MAG TPA: hypothetical protein VGK24_11160 [Candidatus Angelobacter sp.]|jgi:hypothetical protein
MRDGSYYEFWVYILTSSTGTLYVRRERAKKPFKTNYFLAPQASAQRSEAP